MGVLPCRLQFYLLDSQIWKHAAMEGTARKTPGKLIEYLLLRSLSFLLLLVPFSLRAIFLEQITLLFLLASSRYRHLLFSHLKLAFPEKSEQWIFEISRKNARNMGRLFAELIQTPFVTQRFFKRWFVVQKATEQAGIFKAGGMAILGHLGNWEWHGLAGARLAGRNIHTIVKRHTNYWSNAYAERSRNKAGMELVYVDQNPFEIIRLLRKNYFVAFTSDQDARNNGSFFPFFGKEASTFMGPATIARTTKAPVYFVWSYRNENKQLVFCHEALPEVNCNRSEIEEWEKQFTRIWLEKLEEKIRQHPEDYLWAHNRWKTRPSAE